MKILKENSAIAVADEKEAMELFEKVDKDTIWHSCYTYELEAKSIEDTPLFMEQIREEMKMDGEVSDESIQENMQSLNLGLKVPFANGYVGYPLGDTAFGTLIQRAGYANSPALVALADKNQQKRMPSSLKAEVLNHGLNCYTGTCLVMIRDEKVRAVLSDNYSPMAFSNMVPILKSGLQAQFREVYFARATVDHTLSSATFVIKDQEANSKFRAIFASNSSDTIYTSCKLVSSDVGASGANLYPCIVVGGRELMIGSCLSLTHKDGHTIANFAENVQKVFSLFKDASEKLEQMENTPVANPAGCLMRLAKQAGLSKKLSIEAGQELEGMYGDTTTQVDVYWYLQDVFAKMEPDIPSESRKIMLQENIARICFGDMESYDLPFNWE